MDVAVAQRLGRFQSTFFTVITARDVLPPEQLARGNFSGAAWLTPASIWGEIQHLARPMPAEGFSSDPENVGDLESHASLKAQTARAVVDLSFKLLGQDLLTAAHWMDLRKAQDPKRQFGAAPTAAWQAFRKTVPFQAPAGTVAERPLADVAYGWLKATAAASFHPTGMAAPGN
jgi:histidine ammonia-lyase